MIIPATPNWYMLSLTHVDGVPSGYNSEAIIAWEILETTIPMPIGAWSGLNGPHDFDGMMEPNGAVRDIGTGVRYSDRMEWLTSYHVATPCVDRGSYKYKFHLMSVGQEIFIAADPTKVRMSASQYGKRHGQKFSVSKTENGVNVRRVK